MYPVMDLSWVPYINLIFTRVNMDLHLACQWKSVTVTAVTAEIIAVEIIVWSHSWIFVKSELVSRDAFWEWKCYFIQKIITNKKVEVILQFLKIHLTMEKFITLAGS